MTKRISTLFTAVLFSFPLVAQAPPPDSDLYYLVFLRPAPDRKPLAKAEGERIQSAHMANIHSMADRGVLVAAGPFGDTPPTSSGIFVFKTSSLEEARRIAAEDPTVTAHRNTVEVYPWRGPKGIGAEYFRIHKEHPETPENMGVHPFAMVYRGSAWDQAPAERTKIMAAHRAYAERLLRDGKLGAAGPTEGTGDLLGIAIFHRIPDDEAKRLLAEDPAVKAGLFRLEWHRWWSAEHVLPK